MAINAIIVDDEAGNRENLANILKDYCPKVEIIASVASAKEGIKAIHELCPNLVFLDIEMPNNDGFYLLENVGKTNFEVIFVTAYDKYAIKAIKFSALDYLLKPIDIPELIKAVNKVEQQIHAKDSNQRMQVFMQNMLHQNQALKLALPTAEKIIFVSTHDILRCMGDSNYTHFYLTDGRKVIVSRTLKEYEELLTEYNFMRVHRSHLINQDKIKSFNHSDGGYIVMQDGSEVMVSRSKKDSVLKMIQNLRLK